MMVGKRRIKDVSKQVDVSNEDVSAVKVLKGKKISDGRKRMKNKADQVDSPNFSKKAVGRMNKDVLKKKKKIKRKTEHDEEQTHNGSAPDSIGETTAVEGENLVQNQTEQALEKIRKDDNSEDANGQGNVDENEKLVRKQRKAKKKKRRNEMRAIEDNMGRTKKSLKAETIEHAHPKGEKNLIHENKEDEDEVYQIPSEDENSSQGMRKWVTGYYQSRPGLNVLQEKIDEFITAHEAEEEQARIEREEKAAEGGWTVVVHHKGRKKTTDAESGIAVGSVSQAAVMEKMATKKNKDVGLDFYRFQKREAKRNEIMMLQSKFEQDKKRMQELRAQRKFRPY